MRTVVPRSCEVSPVTKQNIGRYITVQRSEEKHKKHTAGTIALCYHTETETSHAQSKCKLQLQGTSVVHHIDRQATTESGGALCYLVLVVTHHGDNIGTQLPSITR